MGEATEISHHHSEAMIEGYGNADPGARFDARRLADEENVLALPGSLFGPGQDGFIRIAFANAEASVMPALAERLAADAAKN